MTRFVLAALAVAVFVLAGPRLAEAQEVKQIFDFYCAQCHGFEGKGNGPNVTEDFATNPRNFTNAEEMSKLSDADIRNVILDGGPSMSKSELMPPWSQTLTEEQVAMLVVYLREFCACTGP